MENKANGWQDEDDRLLAEAVREEFDSCNPPSVEESWAAMAARLRIQTNTPVKGYRRFLKKPLAWGLAASLVLGLAWLSLSDRTEAIGQRFLRFFLHQEDSTVTSSTSLNRSRSMIDAPPPDDQDRADSAASVHTRDVTITEARERSPFPLKQPAYLPVGYRPSGVTLVDRGGNDVDVILRYASGEKELTLIQVYTPGETGSGVGFDMDDTTLKRVNVQGHQGIILSAKDGTARLAWTDKRVTYILSGPLPGDELIKMANSLFTE